MDHHFYASVFVLAFFANGTVAQVTVDPLSPLTVCGSPALPIGFTATGVFNAGNVFTAELSDAAGSFVSPSIVGTTAGTTSGSIMCTFPAGMASGFAMRVSASDPPQTGMAYSLPITSVVPPDGGMSASVVVCSNTAPFGMWVELGGTPDAGGSWTAPTGNPTPNMFDPATDTPGIYTYVIVGDPPCANATTSLVVQVNQAPDAGADASINWCASGGPFLMFDQLTGSPQPGGSWTYSGTPHSAVFVPGTDVPGIYIYTVPGVAPCASVTSALTIAVGACLVPPAPPIGMQYLTE